MGRTSMGRPPRSSVEGSEAGHQRVRRVSHGGPSVSGQTRMGRREDGTFVKKVPDPNPGDRYGELTILGTVLKPVGAAKTRMVRVQCSCGAEPHEVQLYNLLKGASRRCNSCAKKQSGFWRKDYFKYADACPDDAHRRRLLNRLSACKNRCHNPNDSAYANYGGRGIRVHEPWLKDKAAFLRYVLTLDGWDEPRLELDRIDVNKGYEPGNLRFITRKENVNNRRSIPELQKRIIELETRLRHCICGA